MKLYSYYRSSCSYRVRIALNLKGLDFESVPVHLKNNGGEQFSDDYSQKNPGQKVPTLEVDGTHLAESVAIIEYLEATRPETPLFPKDPVSLAKIRQCIEVINSGIQPIQNLALLIKLKKDFAASPEQTKEWIQYWIASGFKTLESLLAQRQESAFSFGDQPSALDCFIVPQVFNANRFEVDLKAFPLISRSNAACLELPAFQKAHPAEQPDTP